MTIQGALYIGYGLGHDILKFYVDHDVEISDEEIKRGVNGFLRLMITCCASGLFFILISFPNKPTGDQIIIIESEFAETVTSSVLEKTSESLEESLVKKEDAAVSVVKEKQTFRAQMGLLFIDPIYLVLLFGVLMGSNTIGGQNVSMAVMLNTFGIPEVILA